MPRRRPRPNVTPIALELIDWLLEGHTRATDDADPRRAAGVYDAFVEFDFPAPDLAGLWRQHRAWLLAEWARRGGTGQPWAAKFDQKP